MHPAFLGGPPQPIGVSVGRVDAVGRTRRVGDVVVIAHCAKQPARNGPRPVRPGESVVVVHGVEMNHVSNCFWLLMQFVRCARSLALASAGSSMAAKIAMIAITTSNSIRRECESPGWAFIMVAGGPEGSVRSAGAKSSSTFISTSRLFSLEPTFPQKAAARLRLKNGPQASVQIQIHPHPAGRQ